MAESSLPATERRPISDIEVLRAIAVLFVIFHHRSALLGHDITAKIDPYFQFWGGVDIFFVISGFVISRGLISARLRSDGSVSSGREIVAFWIRRVWRILPTSWFWLAVIVAMALLTKSDVWGYPPAMTQSVVAIISNLENLHQYFCYHGDSFCGGFPVSLYWSLSLEEQFYFVIPIAMLFLPMRPLIFGMALLIIVQVFLPRPTWGFFWAIRCDGLLLGTAIALLQEFSWVHPLFEPVFLGSLRSARVVFMTLLLLIIAGMAGQHIVPFGTGIMALCSAALVWAASFDKDYLLHQGLLKRLLMWVGARSYAIYLIHVPAFSLTRDLWSNLLPTGTVLDARLTLSFIATAFVLIVVLAELNYRILEQPLRRHGSAVSRRFLAAARASGDPLPVSAR